MPLVSSFPSARWLASFLILVAVLIAPISIVSATTVATGSSNAMASAGDCSMSHGDKAAHHKMGDKLCCASTGVAMTPSLATPVIVQSSVQSPTIVALASLHLSYLGEIATPPPRY